jgi:cytochrome c556
VTCTRILAAMAVLLAGFLACAGADDPDKAPPVPDNIMQKKLEAAQQLLGALAKSDFESIRKNASILNDYSKLAAWKFIETPRYESYSNEFQRITNKMANQAKEKNLDGVALSYVDLTLTCVKCHQHVRDVKVGLVPSKRLEGMATNN